MALLVVLTRAHVGHSGIDTDNSAALQVAMEIFFSISAQATIIVNIHTERDVSKGNLLQKGKTENALTNLQIPVSHICS